MLVVDGGPEASTAIARRFIELARGPGAKIVLILSSDAAVPDAAIREFYRHRFGPLCCTILHTTDRAVADSADFVAPLRDATGVWMTGGKPSALTDIYWHTSTERALHAVLNRGGVVGGSSAGALIQGSRTPTAQPERGFAFLRNTLIMPHLNRGRARDMLVTEISASGTLIGLGVSEQTAALVSGDSLEVIGEGEVVIADGMSHGAQPYALLRSGDRFDLKPRAR
jgi:cyanophycinase